ncbi:DUF433 domain-containing protein [Pseudomonas sp. NY15437]|uniref:DUF433 domain-containing protein n=1 Tax=Pseudomonas sp. NY15437 TaxID=3400360 RepID=UPI003A84D23D
MASGDDDDVVWTNPDIMGGVPVFRGTRIPIDMILGSLDAGYSLEEILDDYPQLSAEKIQQARLYRLAHPRGELPSR